jgi:hypothetical protein
MAERTVYQCSSCGYESLSNGAFSVGRCVLCLRPCAPREFVVVPEAEVERLREALRVLRADMATCDFDSIRLPPKPEGDEG